jgi:hypothetical protein
MRAMTAADVILATVLSGGFARTTAERNTHVSVDALVVVANQLLFHHAAEERLCDLAATIIAAPVFISAVHFSCRDAVAWADALLYEFVQVRTGRMHFVSAENDRSWLCDRRGRLKGCRREQSLNVSPNWIAIVEPLAMRAVVLEKPMQRSFGVSIASDAANQEQLRRAANLK